MIPAKMAPKGATKTAMQPPPPPLVAGLLGELVCGGATAGEPVEGSGLGDGLEVVGEGAAGAVAGATVVGGGAAVVGDEETCDECETDETCDECDECPPEPETCDEWLTCDPTFAGSWPFAARSGNETALTSSRLPVWKVEAIAGEALTAIAATATATGRISGLDMVKLVLSRLPGIASSR